MKIAWSDFPKFARERDGGLAGVAARAKAKLIELLLDRSDDARMAEADLMNIIPVEVEIAPAFEVFQPRALCPAQDIQAGSGKRLVQETRRILGQQRACLRPQMTIEPGLPVRRQIHVAFGAEAVQRTGVWRGRVFRVERSIHETACGTL
jgi:hypothetical protein